MQSPVAVLTCELQLLLFSIQCHFYLGIGAQSRDSLNFFFLGCIIDYRTVVVEELTEAFVESGGLQ